MQHRHHDGGPKCRGCPGRRCRLVRPKEELLRRNSSQQLGRYKAIGKEDSMENSRRPYQLPILSALPVLCLQRSNEVKKGTVCIKETYSPQTPREWSQVNIARGQRIRYTTINLNRKNSYVTKMLHGELVLDQQSGSMHHGRANKLWDVVNLLSFLSSKISLGAKMT